MSIPKCCFSLFLFLLLSFVAALDDPLVHLDYGTFQGKYNNQYNITHFRRIPFAAPPTGQNRFRAPQPPSQIENGKYNTDQAFPMCPQRTVIGSEYCLYLGLYSRPWTKPDAKRPVVVFFYGGAFIQGSASFSIPPPGYPTLNVSNNNNFILVYPNYRVNALGFLPGRKIKQSALADLNPGLLDQQFALQWVQKHIHKFGGDPENVSIWGQSAGGGSVVAQLIANGGKTSPKLFQRALASSPFWPKTYRYDSKEGEALYDQMVNFTGCNAAGDSLQCLKTVDIQKIREASLQISAKHRYTTSSYTWAPVIDGDFLREPLSIAAKNGRINAKIVLGMYNTHEGENFTPGLTRPSRSNGSSSPFENWLIGFLPGLDQEAIQQVEELYPLKGRTETISYNDQSQRAGLIYRDAVLACPAFWVAKAVETTGWLGEFTISPAKHASDTVYVSLDTADFGLDKCLQGFSGTPSTLSKSHSHKSIRHSQECSRDFCRLGILVTSFHQV
jgi:carboxylesterase type B